VLAFNLDRNAMQILGSLQLWPALVSLLAVPSIAYLAFSVWIPETPYYLLKKGHREKALQSLLKLREDDEVGIGCFVQCVFDNRQLALVSPYITLICFHCCK